MTNAEDTGEVIPTEPQIGKEWRSGSGDGKIHGQSWQWYRQDPDASPPVDESDLSDCNFDCEVETIVLCRIKDATPNYTPVQLFAPTPAKR